MSDAPTDNLKHQTTSRGMLRNTLGLLSDAAVYGSSSLITQFVNFFLLKVFTKHLTTVDYGKLAMLSLIGLVFAPLANTGMTNAMFRRYNQTRDPEGRLRVLSTGLLTVAIQAVLLGAVGWLIAAALATTVVDDATATHLVRIAVITAVATTISNVPLTALRAQRRIRTIAVVNILRFAIDSAFSIWFVAYREGGLQGFMEGTLIAEIVMLFVTFWITHKCFVIRPTLETWKSMSAYGLPFVPHAIQAILLAQYGQYVVNHQLSMADGGLYNVAGRFALPVAFVVNSLQQAWVPYKFQIHAEEKNALNFFRSITTYYIAGIGYLWVGTTIWGPDLMRLVVQPNYFSAGQYIPLLALVPFAQGFYFMMGTGAEFAKNTRFMPLITFAGLVAVVVSSIVLVPMWGGYGAATATVLGWLVMACAGLYFSRRHYRVPYDWIAITALVLFAGVEVAVGISCQALPALPRISCLLGLSLLFPVVAAAILLRSPIERERVLVILRRLPWFRSKLMAQDAERRPDDNSSELTTEHVTCPANESEIHG